MTCNDVVGVENGAGSGRCCSGQCLCLLDRVRSVQVFLLKNDSLLVLDLKVCSVLVLNKKGPSPILAANSLNCCNLYLV